MKNKILVEVKNLKKYFPIRGGVFSREIGSVRAIDGVDLYIRKGETLGLVGESGCGKTTVGRCILQLTKPTAGNVYVYFDMPETDARKIEELERRVENAKSDERTKLIRELDKIKDKYNLTKKKKSEIRKLRREMQIVFQDPYSSLSPRMLVRDIVGEPLVVHGIARGIKLREQVLQLLEKVGLNPEHLNRFPHEFSGGQRQRIGVARALALNPKLIILDEPTSALDVSVQAQILNMLKDIQTKYGLTYLFISHHLSVIKHMCNRVAVMYVGKIIELAETREIFEKPLHPYTEALLSAIPIPDPEIQKRRIILTGDVPSPAEPPFGCRFHPRCPKALPICGWSSQDLIPSIKKLLGEEIESIKRINDFSISISLRSKNEDIESIFREQLEVRYKAIKDIIQQNRKIKINLLIPEEPKLIDIGNEHQVACHLYSSSTS